MRRKWRNEEGRGASKNPSTKRTAYTLQERIRIIFAFLIKKRSCPWTSSKAFQMVQMACRIVRDHSVLIVLFGVTLAASMILLDTDLYLASPPQDGSGVDVGGNYFTWDMVLITTFVLAFGLFLLWQLWKWMRYDWLSRRLGKTDNHEFALEQLIKMGEQGVVRLIRTLSGSEVIARRLSAEGLGRIKDPRAVEPLVEALRIPDVVLRAIAAWALGEIGDSQGVPGLLPLLGDDRPVIDDRNGSGEENFRRAVKRSLEVAEGKQVSQVAAEVLSKLGQGELAEAFLAALRGDVANLKSMMTKSRQEIAKGLKMALDSPKPATVVNVARALAEVGAAEALPELRAKARAFSLAEAEVKVACLEAVHRLERTAALPSPSAPPPPGVDTLPTPAGEPQPATDTLPAASTEGEAEVGAASNE